MRALFVSVLIATAAFPAWGARVLDIKMSANAQEVMVGETFQLDVVITRRTNASVEKLAMPDLSAFRIVEDSHGTQQSWSIGGSSRTVTLEDRYTYLLQALRPGVARVGAATGQIGKIKARAPPLSIKVLKAGERRARTSRGPFFVEVRTDREEAFVGEQVLLTVDIFAEQSVDIKDLKMPKLDAFWEQSIDQARVQVTTRTVGAKRYNVYTAVKTLLFPLSPGEVTIGEVTATVQASTGFWRRGKSHLVHSDPVVLKVKALPTEGRPEGFNDGNIGMWRFDASFDPERTTVGQAITLTLRVRGRGNVERVVFPSLPESIEGARLFPPTYETRNQVQRDMVYGERSAQVLIQPLRAGRIVIPSLTLSYFNPQTARYETERTQSVIIPVGASAATPASASSGGAGRPASPVINTRPIHTGLQADAPRVLYRAAWFFPFVVLVLAAAAGGAVLFSRRRAREQSGFLRAQAARKTRRATLVAAREAKDLSACRRVIEDALAERFGDDVRALDAARLDDYLSNQEGAHLAPEVRDFFDACEAALYAPAEGAGRRELFDRAAHLLAALDGEAAS